MSARIWFAVFIGVLAGAASAYQLFNTFWHFGDLAGIAIGVAVAWIALAPVGFWQEFVRQFAKLDESFRHWREERALRQAEISRMRESWVNNCPDVLKVLLVRSCYQLRDAKWVSSTVTLVFIPALLAVEASARMFLLAPVLASAYATLAFLLFARPYPLRERPELIPSNWVPWDAGGEASFRRHYRDVMELIASGETAHSLIRQFWRRWIPDVLFGWWTIALWPGTKWLAKRLWTVGPMAVEALWLAFRYTHSEAHRHVATHTAFGIAIGVWGFNAPVLLLALASATVSVAVWHAVSKRVFQAA